MYSVLIAFLLFLFLAVVFSLQNAEPVIIHFFTWRFEGSLIVVLLTSLAFGVIMTVLATLPSQIKKSRLIVRQQKTIAQLERTVADHTSEMKAEDVTPLAADS